MTDIVTETVEDLVSRIATVPSVKNKLVYMYDQDDLLNWEQALSYPMVGVVYVGMRGKDDSSKTGLASELICDVYVMGDTQCNDKSAVTIGGVSSKDVKVKTTELLDSIRGAIKCNTAPGGRKWKFVHEFPAPFRENDLAYVQRWSTVVLLT